MKDLYILVMFRIFIDCVEAFLVGFVYSQIKLCIPVSINGRTGWACFEAYGIVARKLGHMKC